MCHVPRDNVRADCDVSRAYTCNATNTDGQLVTIISQQLLHTRHWTLVSEFLMMATSKQLDVPCMVYLD